MTNNKDTLPWSSPLKWGGRPEESGKIYLMNTIAKPIEQLIKDYAAFLEDKIPKESAPKIQVDEIALKIAKFYEKCRNVIDYQESHLLRKNTLDRALRRRIFLKDVSGEKIAEPLIREIIRSGHLPNNAIPETKITEVQSIIDFLLALIEQLKQVEDIPREKVSEFLIGIIVCAVEESLAPPAKEVMLGETMFQTLKDHLVINGTQIEEQTRNILLFIAVQRIFLKADEDQLHFRLLQHLHPELWNSLDVKNVPTIAERLNSMREEIEKYKKNPLLFHFCRVTSRYIIVFSIIGDLVFGGKGFDEIDTHITSAYNERYKKEKKKLFRLAFLSVISFFLSKIIVALGIEIPIDVYIVKDFSVFTTVANVIFPPFLMLLIVSSIKLPSSKNLNLVIEEVKLAVFDDNRKEYGMIIPKKKGLLVRTVVYLCYLFIFFLALYYLSKILLWMHFSTANIVVFLLFTSLVTATGVKIYNRSKEMSLEKEAPKFFGFILDVFTIPLVTIGRWVMSGLKRFNILVIIVNFVIELPFQIFVEFLENFNAFIRSKKEEIQ